MTTRCEAQAKMVWSSLFAAGLAYEAWALRAPKDGYTLSEVIREVFRVNEKAGKAIFLGGYVGFSAWFVPHIAARAIEAASEPPRTALGLPAAADRMPVLLRRVLWPTSARP